MSVKIALGVFKVRIVLIILLVVISIIVSACAQTKELSLVEKYHREQALVALLKEALHLMEQESSLPRAREVVELARELAPMDPRVFDALGSIAFRDRSYELAEAYFKEAIRLDGNYAKAYAHLALIAEMRGDKAAAEALYRYALALNPLDGRARHNFALLLAESDPEAGHRQLLRASIIIEAKGRN